MTDWERIQEIIESLREHAQYKPSDVWGSQRRDCNDAADALEAATKPMTCSGCKWELDVWIDKNCLECIRYGSHEDRYEPKEDETNE